MSVTDHETYEGLRSAVRSLIRRTPQSDPQPAITVLPDKFLPVGVGAYVGQHTRLVNGESQTDQLHGRRLQGSLVIRARDATDSGLRDEVSRLRQILFSADRPTFASLGIQRLSLKEIGPRRGSGDQMRRRDLTFDVLFELVRVPEDGQDTIREIDASVEIDGTVESFVVEQ